MHQRQIGSEIRRNREIARQLTENYSKFKPVENVKSVSKVKLLPRIWYKCITFLKSLCWWL